MHDSVVVVVVVVVFYIPVFVADIYIIGMLLIKIIYSVADLYYKTIKNKCCRRRHGHDFVKLLLK